MSDGRNLTDADVEAIVTTLKAQVKQEFLQNLGRGLLGLLWSAVVIIMVALIVLGMKLSPEG